GPAARRPEGQAARDLSTGDLRDLSAQRDLAGFRRSLYARDDEALSVGTSRARHRHLVRPPPLWEARRCGLSSRGPDPAARVRLLAHRAADHALGPRLAWRIMLR